MVKAVSILNAENALSSRLLFPLHCAVVQSRWLHHLCCFRLVRPDLLMKWSLFAMLLKQRWNFWPKCCSAHVRTLFFTLLFTESHLWCVHEDGRHVCHVPSSRQKYRWLRGEFPHHLEILAPRKWFLPHLFKNNSISAQGWCHL